VLVLSKLISTLCQIPAHAGSVLGTLRNAEAGRDFAGAIGNPPVFPDYDISQKNMKLSVTSAVPS
jgi:hypothetical protein